MRSTATVVVLRRDHGALLNGSAEAHATGKKFGNGRESVGGEYEVGRASGMTSPDSPP